MLQVVDIFYVGSPDTGYFAKQYAEQNGLRFLASELMTYKADELENAVYGCQPNWLIINYESISGIEDRTSAALFEALANTLSCEIIILAAGHDRNNNVLTNFAEYGITNFITQLTEGRKRQELEAIIKGEPNEAPPQTPEEIATLREDKKDEYNRKLSRAGVPDYIVNGTPPPEAPPKSSCEAEGAPRENTLASAYAQKQSTSPYPKKISVFGATGRIGTTTIAIQLAKYLMGVGKLPCIVELNGTGYVNALAKYYDAGEGRHTGEIVFEKITFFRDPSIIGQILAMPDYTNVIYDLGSVSDDKFDITVAAGNELAICVMGDSPLDFAVSDKVFDKTGKFYAPQFVFNLVHERARKHILAEMDNLSQDTHFAAFAPDPFILADEHRALFDAALQRGRPQIEPGQKRKGWFKR